MPNPSPDTATFSGAVSAVFAFVGTCCYSVITEPPTWLQAVAVPLLASALAGVGPIVARWMRERYDGKLRAEQRINERLRADIEVLEARLREPEKDGMGL